MPLPNRRFICSIVKKVDGVLKANIVVVAELTTVSAREKLCQKYGIPNIDVVPTDDEFKYSGEGIKSIRFAETNMYESDNPEFDNFRDDS